MCCFFPAMTTILDFKFNQKLENLLKREECDMESWIEIENSFCSGGYCTLTLYRTFQK
jgi:hypothetical protein